MSWVKKVSFPETITTIGEQAFALCKGLTVAVLPEGLEIIKEYAFGNAGVVMQVYQKQKQHKATHAEKPIY